MSPKRKSANANSSGSKKVKCSKTSSKKARKLQQDPPVTFRQQSNVVLKGSAQVAKREALVAKKMSDQRQNSEAETTENESSRPPLFTSPAEGEQEPRTLDLPLRLCSSSNLQSTRRILEPVANNDVFGNVVTTLKRMKQNHSTSPPESQTAHTSKLSATESLSIAIPPKSSKVARTRSEEVAGMRGPFPNPIELSVISKYRDEQYKESGVFDGPVSGLPPVESSDMVFLQVGDVLISEDPEKRESSYVVYDFRKNAVVVDFKVTEENTLNAADFDKGWYFRQRRMQDGSVNTKRIKSSRYLAVRRDPEKTTANIQVAYGKFKERMNLINPTVDLPPPIQVRGAGGIDDFPLCSLREVPDTSATPSASALQMPDLASFAPLVTAGSRKTPCFFCNEPIFLPIPISAWHIDLPIADSRDRHRYTSFRDHCSSNHPQMPLWTMVANAKNTFLAGEPYLLKDHVQKCLSQAVCSNPIPYELFLSVMLGNDVPLRYHFGVLFGFTRGAVTYADTVRKLKCHKPPNRGTKAKVEDLSASAERKTGVSGENNMQPGYTKGEQVKNTQKFKTATMNVLEKIENCFEKFNFQELGSFFSVHESFVKSGKKTEQQALLLWNVVNLFFCRGLYMEPPFPPLLHLGPIESTDYSGDAASVDDSQLIEWSELTLDAWSNPNGNV